MEGGDNILDAILEEENLDDVGVDADDDVGVDADDDVEMVDIEEGELVEHDSMSSRQNVSGLSSAGGDADEAEKKSNSKNRRRRANKKKNKRNRAYGGAGGAIDINRFVLDTCRRLKEKKSYMVYTAVGCLGVSALSELIKEVDAIQACGGQKTADGKRLRTGGGVLWSIIKVREPHAFKEIMKKTKEFEKQFRQPNVKPPPMQKKEESSEGMANTSAEGHLGNTSDNTMPESQMQDQHEPSGSEEKRVPVHDRLRIPVSYDDDLLGLGVDNDAA